MTIRSVEDSTPSPYQRIMRAAKANKGVRLTAEEVQHLSEDNAIQMAAQYDDRCDAEGK